MSAMKRIFLGTAATLFVAAVFAAEPTMTLVAANGGSIELPWAKQWAQSKDAAYDPETVAFVLQSDPSAMHAMISPGRRVSAAELTEERLLELMARMTSNIAGQAVEKDLAAQPLAGGANRGWFVTATDKAPKPGEYQYITLVLAVADDIPVISTILFNDAGKADAGKARAAISNLKVNLPSL
jgi:hypothetical protein